MKSAKIDVTKILKEHLFAATSGAKYLDITLIENRDGPDKYGNDGFITQSVSKEARERGEKGPIIGNWKRITPKKAAPAKPAPSQTEQPDDDIPFN